jgi:hypothetical protein
MSYEIITDILKYSESEQSKIPGKMNCLSLPCLCHALLVVLSLLIFLCLFGFWFFLFCFGRTGAWTQGFMLARQRKPLLEPSLYLSFCSKYSPCSSCWMIWSVHLLLPCWKVYITISNNMKCFINWLNHITKN